MSFFGDVLGNIGKFFGGGKEEEEKRRIQQQPRVTSQQLLNPTRPSTTLSGSINAPPADLLPPQSPLNAPPKLGGVKMENKLLQGYDRLAGLTDDEKRLAQKVTDRGDDPTSFISSVHARNDANKRSVYDNSAFGKTGNFIENVVNEAVAKPTFQAAPRLYNTFTSRKADDLPQSIKDSNAELGSTTEELGSNYREGQNPFIGTLMTAGDIASLLPIAGPFLGKGIKALTKTEGPAGDILKSIGKVTNKEIKLPGRKFNEGQLIEDGTALGSNAGKAAERELDDLITQTEKQPTPREPGNPMTAEPTTNKAPAISSPGQRAAAAAEATRPPTLQAPAPAPLGGIGQQAPTAPPQIGGIAPLRAPVVREAMPAPVAERPMAPTPEQVLKSQLDEVATAPSPEVAPIQAVRAETPLQAEGRVLAESQPPVNQAAVQAQAAAEAKAQAPTEAIANNPLDPETNALIDELFGDKKPTPAPKTEPVAQVPDYSPPNGKNGRAGVSGYSKVHYNTGDNNLDGLVNDSIVANKGTANTAQGRADALDQVGVDSVKRARIRNIAVKETNKETGRISDHGIEQIKKVLSGNTKTPDVKAPALSEPAPEGKLGTITRKAVQDGVLETEAGKAKVIADVTRAAESEAKAAGTTLADINRKGQKVWKDSKATSHEYTTNEAMNGYTTDKGVYHEGDPSFTPEQQAIYKAHAQEITTLRDRSSHSLTGGNQGEWYGPRQALEDGASADFDPSLVNEIKRAKNGGVVDTDLDTSAVPYEQAIRRYMDAPDAGVQRLTDAVENKVVTAADGTESVVKRTSIVTKESKEKLTKNLEEITKKRDQASRLEKDGDVKGARKLANEVQKDTNKAFSEFMDEIPGTHKDRREAISEVKAMRGVYEQTLSQTLTLSNVVNRVADRGAGIVETFKQPLVRALEKKLAPSIEKRVMKGAEVNKLNTTKEARQAAREFAKGTMFREIRDNARAVVSNAGAGRNIVAKGIAKLDAGVRAAGGALVQTGDLSTSNVREALQIGASREAAAGLKTKDEYIKYFGNYVNTKNFQQDLAKVEKIQNPKIGLAGGEIQGNKNSASNFLSKNVDNLISTQANKFKPGLGDSRAIREVNDLWKGNVTGYSGVGSRVFGTFRDAAVPNRVLKAVVKEAASGDPAAVARATKMAAHAVTDTVALYGTTATAAGLAGMGIIGYTGAQAERGSSESAYNKAGSVPSNQWYVNIGDKRVYFDPARPTGAAGIGADIGGSIATGGKDIADTATNIAGQVFNQAGGSSLPENIENVRTGYMDSGATKSDKSYARGRVEGILAPSTGLLNNVANWQDPNKKAPRGFTDNLQASLPGLRNNVKNAEDSRGNVIANSKQISGGSMIFSVGKNTDSDAVKSADPVGTEIDRLQKKYGDVFPTNQNTNATMKNTQNMADIFTKSDAYKSADDDTKRTMMKDILGGTKTKDVNDKLSDVSKLALTTSSLMDATKRAVWKENNDNDLNYQRASYENKEANNTLTSDDRSMEKTGSLAQKVAIAQVNKDNNTPQDLKQGYKDTNKTEFKKMAEGPEKDRLRAYDKALFDAGLPSKYGVGGSGKGGSRGRGGSGGKKGFAFANLPGSLSGVGGTGSDGKGYAKSAPLFKPVASLRAPAGEIPKGRTISVKKGVKL